MIGAFRTGIAVNHRVRTRAKFFFQGDYKFFVKGVTYGTFAPDADGVLLRHSRQSQETTSP